MSWPRRLRELIEQRPGAGDGAVSLRELIDRLPEDARAEALRHSSWADDRLQSYERLAFLGDSVLGLSVAAHLYREMPSLDAGELTKILNQAVSGSACSEVGEAVGIPEMLRQAEPPAKTGSHTPASALLAGERPLPEVTEALIGACFLEFGYDRTAAAVALAFESRIEQVRSERTDFKTGLQELLARVGETVSYEVVGTSGPPHERVYEVVALVEGEELGRGSGRSKKVAGQAAAEAALSTLENPDDEGG